MMRKSNPTGVLLITVVFIWLSISINEAKIIQEFNACFQASMQKAKDNDESIGVLINPEQDPKVIASIFPMIKVNKTALPTELTNDNLTDYPEVTNNSIAFLSMSKVDRKEKIRYLLFTKENKDQFQVMSKDGNVEGTKWRPDRKTKIIVHGLTSSVWVPPMVNIWSQHVFEIKDAYLNKRADASFYNVIIMDWTSLSTVPLAQYPEAAYATQEAGEELADFLIKLRESNNILHWEDVHILGHSLGAHVAGSTGLKLRQMGPDYELERITGLDPAGLCFDTNSGNIEDLDSMLDSSDAKFVDIMHTNMGNVVLSAAGRYGSQMQTGHADFYPNGGETQNSCNFLEDRLNFCSHQKSVVFYANSITDKTVACPCTDWHTFRTDIKCNCNIRNNGQYMGEYCSNTARGKYFLNM